MFNLKRVVGAFLVLCLFAGIAYAAQNIKQKDSGGAVWQDTRKPFSEYPVGGPLFVTVTDISSASSSAVIAHKSGFIKRIDMAIGSVSTMSTTTITFLRRDETGNSINSGQFQPISAGSSSGGGQSYIQVQTTGPAVWGTSVRFLYPISGRTNWITQGSVLVINSDGVGSNTVPANFWITIE